MRSSGMSAIYGVMMTLLLALLAGVVWLTLSSQPGLPNQPASNAPVATQPAIVALATATPLAETASSETAPATQAQPATALPTDTETPTSEPTATTPPLPTETNTPEPTATATATASPTPTPLSLPLPTPEKVARLQLGWEVLSIGAPVTALASDSNGFVWLGTQNSVTQQNPNDWQIAWNFAAGDIGLDGSGITAILGDKQGGVWVGGNGAAYFNGMLWRTFTVSDGLSAGIVQVIAEDNQRRVWIGTSAGLSIWNGASFFRLDRQSGLPNDDITALFSDGPRMWIGTNGSGLFRFENNQLQVFNMDNIGLETNVVTALGKLPDGKLLIGSDKGLMTFAGSRAEPLKDVPKNRITAIVSTLLSDVWVATDGGGLHRLINGQWSRLIDNANLPDSRIVALTVHSYGAIWIATGDGQLTRWVGGG